MLHRQEQAFRFPLDLASMECWTSMEYLLPFPRAQNNSVWLPPKCCLTTSLFSSVCMQACNASPRLLYGESNPIPVLSLPVLLPLLHEALSQHINTGIQPDFPLEYFPRPSFPGAARFRLPHPFPQERRQSRLAGLPQSPRQEAVRPSDIIPGKWSVPHKGISRDKFSSCAAGISWKTASPAYPKYSAPIIQRDPQRYTQLPSLHIQHRSHFLPFSPAGMGSHKNWQGILSNTIFIHIMFPFLPVLIPFSLIRTFHSYLFFFIQLVNSLVSSPLSTLTIRLKVVCTHIRCYIRFAPQFFHGIALPFF